jgi:hypothetical protein
MTMSTDNSFWPVTGWFYALGVDSIRSVLKVLAETGLIQGRMSVQYAVAVNDESGNGGREDWIALGTFNVDEGMWTQEAALTTTGKMYFRIGVCFALTGGAALAQADVVAFCSFRDDARTLAKGTAQLSASTTGLVYIPFGTFVGAHGLDSIRAALVVNGVTGVNLRSQLAMRTADLDPKSPNAWAVIGASQAGAVKVCQDVSVAATTNPGAGTKPFFIQFGAAVWLTAAGPEETATVSLDLAGRYV